MTRPAALLALLLLAPGCLMEVRRAGPEADALLAAALWRPPARLLLRQVTLVAVAARRLPIEGLLELDPKVSSARLVALDPLGVKLFDVTVRAGAPPETHGSPPPSVAGAIAAVSESLQRIYLSPPSSPASGLREEGGSRIVSIAGGSLRETWVIDAATGHLTHRMVRERGADWEVSYGPRVPLGGTLVPGEIRLRDRKAGYSLTIRTVEVMRGDE
jgi:hypothetical protein